jgi:hypothetical protein
MYGLEPDIAAQWVIRSVMESQEWADSQRRAAAARQRVCAGGCLSAADGLCKESTPAQTMDKSYELTKSLPSTQVIAMLYVYLPGHSTAMLHKVICQTEPIL